MRVVAGIGCRKGAPVEQVAAALDQALGAHRLGPPDVAALATGGAKSREPAIHALAQARNWPLRIVADDELRAVADRCLTRSAQSMKHAALPSLSEAAALAAAGPGARLLGPRIARDGVTCALARMEPTP